MGGKERTTVVAAQPDAERWDLSEFFPSLDSREYREFAQRIAERIAALEQEAVALPPLNEDPWTPWVDVLCEAEATEAALHHLGRYVHGLTAADETDEEARSQESRVNTLRANFEKAQLSLQTGIARATPAAFSRLCADERLAKAAWRLEHMRARAATLLSADEERLAADLSIDAFHRWGQLAQAVLSQLKFPMRWPNGVEESLPVAYRYDLLWSADAPVRKAAFDGINSALEPVEPALAASLNGIAGFRTTLARHRNVDVVDEALERNAVDRDTIEGMLDVFYAQRSRLYRYLELKARILGLPALGVYDRSAPLPVPELDPVSLTDAKQRVLDAFRPCPPLVRATLRIYERGWLEAEKRPGKRTGAFCMNSPLLKQSRVFMSYGGSFNSITALAHEIGHAFHNDVLSENRYWAQRAPLTLAETASNVAENLLRNAVLADPRAARSAKAGILGAQLDTAVNNLLRIPRDFEFDVAFYRERAAGDVPAHRLRALMSAAHRRWFGEIFSGDGDDQMAWAYTRHLYFTDTSFYNFPYSFGFVLSCRIAAEFVKADSRFVNDYVAFLRASGSMPAEEAIRSTLGYDVRKAAYWTDAYEVIDRQIDELERLWES